MTERLLPCPFCGGTSVEADHKEVWCYSCGAQGPAQRREYEEHGAFSGELAGGALASDLWNRRASGWISVKERLPEEGQLALVFASGKVGTGMIDSLADERADGRRFLDSWWNVHLEGEDFADDGVAPCDPRAPTHWMPLPTPPA